jgi:hypothetical protein
MPVEGVDLAAPRSTAKGDGARQVASVEPGLIEAGIAW